MKPLFSLLPGKFNKSFSSQYVYTLLYYQATCTTHSLAGSKHPPSMTPLGAFPSLHSIHTGDLLWCIQRFISVASARVHSDNSPRTCGGRKEEGRVEGERRGGGGNWREGEIDCTNRTENIMQACYTLAMTLFYPILYYMKYVLSYHGSGCCRRTGLQCLLPSAAPAQN